MTSRVHRVRSPFALSARNTALARHARRPSALAAAFISTVRSRSIKVPLTEEAMDFLQHHGELAYNELHVQVKSFLDAAK